MPEQVRQLLVRDFPGIARGRRQYDGREHDGNP